MPKLQQTDPNAIVRVTTGSITFSAARIDTLRASEWTLADIAVDCSQSVKDFKGLMEDALGKILASLQASPRKGNLLCRVHTFTDPGEEVEIHGFVPVLSIDPAIYVDCLKIGVMTALNDATFDGMSAIGKMGEDLSARNYQVNAVEYVITDGVNNRGTTTPTQIKNTGERIRGNETLESFITILIGVNVKNPYVQAELDKFHQEAGLTHFVPIEDASKDSLDALAQFVSSSIISTSQQVGQGGPSQMIAPGVSITI